MAISLFRRWLSASRRRLGASVLQTTVVVGSLSVLAASATPVVEQYVRHARVIHAHGDVRVLGSALVLFMNDLGAEAKGIPGGTGARARPIELMAGEGRVPEVASARGAGWQRTDAGVVTFKAFLVDNAPGFPVKAAKAFGWNGPYLNDAPDADPWGTRYAFNAGVLPKGRKYMAVVACAGPDATMALPFDVKAGEPVSDLGDDIFEVVR